MVESGLVKTIYETKRFCGIKNINKVVRESFGGDKFYYLIKDIILKKHKKLHKHKSLSKDQQKLIISYVDTISPTYEFKELTDDEIFTLLKNVGRYVNQLIN